MARQSPGFGDVGSMSNYAAFPAFLKISSLLEMLIGRLEIFPILESFSYFCRLTINRSYYTWR